MGNRPPPATDLSTNTLKAIVAAANRNAVLPDEAVEALRGWLAQNVMLACGRAYATPLGRQDVERVGKAYDAFREALADLQGSDDPPPQLPSSNGGWTAWDQWLTGHRHFDTRKPRGQPEVRDWRLIGELVALYEIISGQQASAANEGNETTTFLDRALSLLEAHLPHDRGDRFAWPRQETLKDQLPKLRAAIRSEKRFLGKLLAAAGRG